MRVKKKKVHNLITTIRSGVRALVQERSDELLNENSTRSEGSKQGGGYHQHCSSKASPKSPFQNKLKVDFAP